jgi:phage shock protein A
MSDSLQDRVARLISGSAHALLDKVEELAPEAVLAQAIRDIDQVIGEVRAELGRVEAAKHQLVTRLSKLTDEHEDLSGKAELAIQEQRDDLATACLERQTLIEDQLPVLQQNLQTQRELSLECESYLRALMARKQERSQVLAEFLASRRQQNTPGQRPRQDMHEQRVDRAESAFDRVMARETGVHGYSTNQGDAMKLKELADLQRKKRIDERLNTLKQQISDKP